jgi:hypothetical protein
MFNIVVSESLAFYDIIWKDMVGAGRQHTTKLHNEKRCELDAG